MSTIDTIKRSDIRLFRNVEASVSETAKCGKKNTQKNSCLWEDLTGFIQ